MGLVNHYVYKITDSQTHQFYIGSRTCNCLPEDDDYMGSPYVWSPENKNRLKKEIIKNDFEDREDAIEYEAQLIEQNIEDELNENYHIPGIGFHTFGNEKVANKISKALRGRKFTKKHKEKLSESKKKWIKENGHPMKGKYGKNHWRYGKGYPEESKLKMSKKISGENNPMYGMTGSLNPFYGKTHTDETKMIMSERIKKAYESIDVTGENNPASKKVIHIDTGIIFITGKEASDYFGVTPQTISHHCNGRIKNKKFEFLER